MERSEHSRLETIKRNLQKNLKTVIDLLRTAHAPQRLSRAAIKERARAICKEITKRGGRVSREELRDVVANAKMPFHAVGALFGADYLRKAKGRVVLGKRGQAIILTRALHVRRRAGTRARKTPARRKR